MNEEIRKNIRSVLKEAVENAENTPWCFILADKLAQKHKKYSEIFRNRKIVWVGIGGSSSGPRAIFRFFGLDGVFLESPEDTLDKYERRNLFYVVSKSGTTYETLAIFEKVLSGLKRLNFSTPKSILTVSQEIESPLMNLVRKYGISNIPFPQNLSGRFSTFYITYFPLLGLAPKILNGIVKGLDVVRKDIENENSLHFRLAEFFLENLDKQDIFLCFYSRKIFEFSENITQLIAESLGKDNKGFTPVAVLGPQFQHSVAQLVLANPKSKFAIFFVPKEKRYKLVQKEAYATHKVFSEKIPTMIVEYEEKPQEISKMLFSLQLSIAVCGKIMGINPFDQPEVKRIRDILESS